MEHPIPAWGIIGERFHDGNLPNLSGSVVVGWYNLPRPTGVLLRV